MTEDDRFSIISNEDWAQARDVAHGRTPADEVMEREEMTLSLRDAIETEDGSPIDDEAMEQRLQHWRTFLAFVFQGGACNPWQAFKNFLAAVRRVRPEYLDGISQTHLAQLLGETRAATSAREIRVVETILKRWGVQGFHMLGGTKSESARKIYAEVQRGNSNRRSGRKQKHKPIRE